jgi:hypothetical protein
LGSAYLADVERFSKISSWLRAEDWKILVVPHDVGQNHLSALSERLSRHWAVKAVETPSFPHDSRELFLLGKVGLLFEAYALSSKAWVGFGPRGLHNVLEPLSFGLSVGCAGGLDAQPLANQFSGTLLRVILKEDDLKDWLTSNLVIEKKAATPTVVPSELQEWFP